METATTQSAPTASEFIDRKIAALGDWRGIVLARVRALIHQAVPDVIEEVKWMGTPVWSCKGIICTGESYTTHVKLTFLKGAVLPDPAGIFNASLDGNARRAVDLREGDELDSEQFIALVQAAAALNAEAEKSKRSRTPARRGPPRQP
jgi:hypothetical protein